MRYDPCSIPLNNGTLTAHMYRILQVSAHCMLPYYENYSADSNSISILAILYYIIF